MFWNVLPVGTASMTSRVITFTCCDALGVDDRRFTCDRHRFGDRADTQLRVDRCAVNSRGELDAFTLDGGELRAA